MISEVLRKSPSSRGRRPYCPSRSCSPTDLHSQQTPKALGANESTGNFGGSGGSGSALLFIAPFFGVVLLSLGVIAVKYCLRYNARNRIGVTNDNRGSVTRQTVPRPHWRRHEKELMTVDELNKQFPMMKYRSWASERARDGSPTPGGVAVPVSRANSTRDLNGIDPDISVNDRHPTEQRRPSDVAASSTSASLSAPLSERKEDRDVEKTEFETNQPANPCQISGTQGTSRQVDQGAPNDNDSAEDEHIDVARSPKCPSTGGDTCAICISTLEDDDDIRALTCGHVFHAVCVDFWLTSRRACCPVCNANYYTPKPKPNPEGDTDAATNLGLRDNNRLNVPGAMRAAWFRRRNSNSSCQGTSLIRCGGESRSLHTNRDHPQDPSQLDGVITPAPLVQARPLGSVRLSNDGVYSPVQPPQWFGQPENNQPTTQNAESTANETTTPSQLEAGSCQAAPSKQ